jgi:O-methyltransferase
LKKLNIEKDYIDLLKSALMGCLENTCYNEVGAGKKSGIKKAFQTILKFLIPKNTKLIRLSQGSKEERQMRSDSTFNAYTLVGYKRLQFLEESVKEIAHKKIDGDILEAGLWRGGASIFIKKMMDIVGLNNQLYCADSFEGMPKPKLKTDLDSLNGDYSKIDFYTVGLEKVIENFKNFNALDSQVHFVKGWFSETMPLLREKIKKISLLRVDCDLYESTLDVLVNMYDKVSEGGFVYIDDYYGWEGCRKAVDEFRLARSIDQALVTVDRDSVYWNK